MKYDFLSVGDIFKKYKKIYVPYYQRDYVWGYKNDGRNLYKFIDDIFTQFANKPESDYFIGTLAFCAEKVNDVIDGQQRITSLVLILSLLSDLKCSDSIRNKNKKIIKEDNDFIIQEEFYLTEELKKNLGLNNNFNSQGYKVDISKTVDKIKNQINMAWGGYQESWYDNLYEFILNNVKCITLEYSNIGESLKYFLNINSLSIQLTQSDIFYSILSQSLRISNNLNSIFKLKQKISTLAENSGIKRDIEGYKCYDQNNKGIDNIIYIFLNARFQNHKDIGFLNETGIGKWISFYENEMFNDQLKAKEFVEDFINYLDDFEKIYGYFSNIDSCLNVKSSLYMSWVLLQYEGYFDCLKVLTELFRTRHNYIDGRKNLYENGTKDIDYAELNEIAKRLNLTIFWNYIRSSNKRLDGFITNITLDNNGNYKRTIGDITNDITIDDIFNLNYNDKKNISKINIPDQSRIIKVIFAYQEALLNSTANISKDINEYLKDILASNAFSIEHIYSVSEYLDKDRLKNWITIKNKFTDKDGTDFDTERFKFENLSLLDLATNASANDDAIYDKLPKYRNARRVSGSEWEYLIQSLVKSSKFYTNPEISKLNLPNRFIENISGNTWDLSDNNRKFNIELMKMVIEKIANK